jgi:Domain of unknown function (DUF3846)
MIILSVGAEETIRQAPLATADAGQLQQLQEAVGGYIELVPGFTSIDVNGETVACLAFCNEHGKINNLPVNYRATKLWDQALRRDSGRGLSLPAGGIADYLVGSIVIVHGEEMQLMEDEGEP